MKKVITEELGEGLEKLLGRRVLLLCAGYFYEGELIGVNEKCVLLKDAHIVYSTGAWSDDKYSDRQKLQSDEWYVMTGLIESFGLSKDD